MRKRLVCFAAMVLFVLCRQGLAQVIFELRADMLTTVPAAVCVTGPFNAWSIEATPMAFDGAVWRTAVSLPDGRHFYKFKLRDAAGAWHPMPDPCNPFKALRANRDWCSFVDVNGDIQSARFNAGWVDKFQGALSHAAHSLRNCRWTQDEGQIVLYSPWLLPGNDNLTEFNWKGFWIPHIVTHDLYLEYQNYIKATSTNCHGNSAHCFGVMNLNIGASQVGPSLIALGATFTQVPSILKENIMNEIQIGCIIFFDASPAAAPHSAYVVSKGQDLSNTIIWACNAGVAAEGTKAGFDEVTLAQYFADHPAITHVSLYTNIH